MAEDTEPCEKNGSYNLGHVPRAGWKEEFTKGRKERQHRQGPWGIFVNPVITPNCVFLFQFMFFHLLS